MEAQTTSLKELKSNLFQGILTYLLVMASGVEKFGLQNPIDQMALKELTESIKAIRALASVSHFALELTDSPITIAVIADGRINIINGKEASEITVNELCNILIDQKK